MAGFGTEHRFRHGNRFAQELHRPGFKHDPGTRELTPDTLDNRRDAGRGTVVITLEHPDAVGERPDDGNRRGCLPQRQNAVVLQQYDALARHLQGPLAMCRAVHGRGRHGTGRIRSIKHTQLKAHRQRAAQCPINVGLGNESLFESLTVLGIVLLVSAEFDRAFVVHADLEGCAGRGRLAVDIVMAAVNVVHGIAVRNHEPLETPAVAQHCPQQKGACASGNTVDRVVDAHHGGHVRVDDGSAEGGKISISQIMR